MMGSKLDEPTSHSTQDATERRLVLWSGMRLVITDVFTFVQDAARRPQSGAGLVAYPGDTAVGIASQRAERLILF